MFCYIPYSKNLVHLFPGSVTRSLPAFLRLQKGAKRGGGCARKGGRGEGAREGREKGAREQKESLCVSPGSTWVSWKHDDRRELEAVGPWAPSSSPSNSRVQGPMGPDELEFMECW